jgi:hypothetical protein
MTIAHWIQKSMPPFIVTILSINLLLGCVSKENIEVPASQPIAHPRLAKMQSLSLQEKDNVTYFGKSRKYYKNGILVVVLSGDPYEIGFTRGALLRDEIRDWIKYLLYLAKRNSLGTSYGENRLKERAKEVEEFIPPEYREELQGLSAGSDIDYDVLLVVNILAPIVLDVACTSIVVKSPDASLLRSRNLDLNNHPALPAGLYFYKPTNGHAFVSISHIPGFIGTRTAFNETGLNIGAHDISRTSRKFVKGEPEFILRREVAQYAGSVKEAGQILKAAQRSGTKMWLVADSKTAGIYEFNSEKFAYYEMVEDYLILTNHTRILNIGRAYDNSFYRYNEAEAFLVEHQGEMDINTLIDLNRGNEICFTEIPELTNLHSAIFRADTLDFWIAAGPPPATRGRWVGFNLKKELYGSGKEPKPLIVPAAK